MTSSKTLEAYEVVMETSGGSTWPSAIRISQRRWSIEERLSPQLNYPDHAVAPAHIGVYRAVGMQHPFTQRIFVIVDGMEVKSRVDPYNRSELSPLTLEPKAAVLADASCISELGASLLKGGHILAASKLAPFFAGQFDALSFQADGPVRELLRRAKRSPVTIGRLASHLEDSGLLSYSAARQKAAELIRVGLLAEVGRKPVLTPVGEEYFSAHKL